MNRVGLWSFVSAAALCGVASSSAAHHPPRFESCQRFTFTGQLERIEWTNPHVLLSVRTDDGTSRQVGWLNTRALRRAGIDADTLHVGDRLRIEGGVRKNDSGKVPILLSSVRRAADGWEWSQPLQGC